MYRSSRYGSSISAHPEIKTALYFLFTEVRKVEGILNSSIGVMGLACSIITRQMGYRVKDHTLVLIWSGQKAGNVEGISNLYWLAGEFSSRPLPLAAVSLC